VVIRLKVRDLPDFIGMLYQLSYFGLFTFCSVVIRLKVRDLPDSIGMLYQLSYFGLLFKKRSIRAAKIQFSDLLLL
jgi:hypothetical protein